MLVGNNITDTTAVDTEHADNGEILDLVAELSGLFAMLDDELAEL